MIIKHKRTVYCRSANHRHRAIKPSGKSSQKGFRIFEIQQKVVPGWPTNCSFPSQIYKGHLYIGQVCKVSCFPNHTALLQSLLRSFNLQQPFYSSFVTHCILQMFPYVFVGSIKCTMYTTHINMHSKGKRSKAQIVSLTLAALP